jgi:hypothetical protein
MSFKGYPEPIVLDDFKARACLYRPGLAHALNKVTEATCIGEERVLRQAGSKKLYRVEWKLGPWLCGDG